jgi:hypothetical protein
MSGLTNYTSQGLLNHITGKTAIAAMRPAYVALFSAVGLDDGTGFTEISGSAYARVTTAAADWATASGTAPSTVSNANPLVFPTSTGSWGTIVGFGVYDAATAGNLMAWDYFGSFAWFPVAVSAASPGVITQPRHAYLNGDTVMFTTEYGGTPPTFSQGNFTGVLTVANALTDTFTVTQTGTAVNTSTSGDGMVRKFTSQAVGANVQATFPAGSLVISLA